MQTFEESSPVDPAIDPAIDPAGAFVVTSFEACATFTAAGSGSPECLACGWLGHEHRPEGRDEHDERDAAAAGVRILRAFRSDPDPGAPERLAS